MGLAQIARGIVEKLADKQIEEGKEDTIGQGDQWAEERLKTCTDDYTYDLAVEIRKLREEGTPWWRIAQMLELPGNGASAKQGRAGAAFARRVWAAAWGKTYGDTNGQRETKEERVRQSQAQTSRPYFQEEALEMDIINKLCGQKVVWVTRLAVPNGLVLSEQETYVHADLRLIKVKLGPKGRYVEFFEQPDPELLRINPQKAIAKAGPLRSVYLDRITKVGA